MGKQKEDGQARGQRYKGVCHIKRLSGRTGQHGDVPVLYNNCIWSVIFKNCGHCVCCTPETIPLLSFFFKE